MIAPSLAVDYFRDQMVRAHVRELGYGEVDYSSNHAILANPRSTPSRSRVSTPASSA